LSILSAFSTLALVLGVIGVYGAVSFTVAQRRREIGLRLALGSSPRGVQTLVLLDGSRMMLFGTVLGTLVALIGSPITRGLLFGVAPVDPVVYLAVPALLMCAGLVACWWPARSAARTELVEVLRTE
jgi:ABC-type antimicrobial peptide transport system permease subunit